jgi:hypothetical protein
MIYLTAIGLTPGGSSTHLHTKQYIEQHKQYREQHIIDTKQYVEQQNSRVRKSARYTLAFALQLRKKHGKPHSG